MDCLEERGVHDGDRRRASKGNGKGAEVVQRVEAELTIVLAALALTYRQPYARLTHSVCVE